MARIEVAQILISLKTADHLWEKHRIDADQIATLIERYYVVTRNHRRATTPYKLIGEDDQGRCIAVPIAPTDDPLTWRAASAWYCSAEEAWRLDH